ncbi:MAG TPA: F0F1 ATP synthase subunit B [Gammaproteobacteria bacterium]|nr:F0F1 ATP synthase subunit B [Gammaproteobacteria bacterium]
MNITATLIGQIAAFVLLIWFVNKVLWGPVTKLLEDRQKRIADGLSAAEKGKHELALAEEHAKEALRNAKSQAADILAQAEKRGAEIIEEAKVSAREEGERLIAAAKADIEREVNQAREQLRGQVAELAVLGAQQILKREIDAKAHDDLVKSLVAQL